VTPDGRHVFVANAGADLVTLIETATNTVVAHIPGLPQPVGVAASAREVYVTHYQEAGVSVLDI